MFTLMFALVLGHYVEFSHFLHTLLFLSALIKTKGSFICVSVLILHHILAAMIEAGLGVSTVHEPLKQ